MSHNYGTILILISRQTYSGSGLSFVPVFFSYKTFAQPDSAAAASQNDVYQMLGCNCKHRYSKYRDIFAPIA